MDKTQSNKYCRQLKAETHLAMILGEFLRRGNNLVQISIHQLICNVNIIEILSIRWSYNILNFNNLQRGNNK